MKQNTALLRLLTAAIAVLAAVPAWGQSAYDPRVAYTVTSGKSADLYLANEDGSHAQRVATGFQGIYGIDLAPGGGRIAFTDGKGLKLLSYTILLSGIRVDSEILLVPAVKSLLDFSPDGSRILYFQNPTDAYQMGFYAIPSAGGAPVFLLRGSALGAGRWLPHLGNAFAYLATANGGPNIAFDYEVRVVLLDANDQVETVATALSTAGRSFNEVNDFDVARTSNGLLLSVGYPSGSPLRDDLVAFDIDSGSSQAMGIEGFKAHYSSDDARIIYRNVNYRGTPNIVYSMDVASGQVTALTKKGSFHWTDARP